MNSITVTPDGCAMAASSKTNSQPSSGFPSWESTSRTLEYRSQAEQSMPLLEQELSRLRAASIEPPLGGRTANVTVMHPGGGIGRFTDLILVAGEERAFVLHHGYLHHRSNYLMRINSIGGVPIDIPGICEDCKHVSSTVHVCQIRFERKLDLRQFIRGYRSQEEAVERPLSPSELCGRIVAIDDDPLVIAFLEATFQKTRVRLETFNSLPRALDRLRSTYFHLALCDAHLEPAQQAGVSDILRNGGQKGPTILLVGEKRSLRATDQDLAAQGQFLQKPIMADALFDLLGVLLRPSEVERLPGQIVSAYAKDASMSDLIEDYVVVAHREGEIVRRAIEKGEFDAARTACQHLRETGGSFGFQQLTDASQAAVTAMDASMSISECLRELDLVVEIAARLAAFETASAGMSS